MRSNPSKGTLAQRMVTANPGKRLTSLVSPMEPLRWLADSLVVLLPPRRSQFVAPVNPLKPF